MALFDECLKLDSDVLKLREVLKFVIKALSPLPNTLPDDLDDIDIDQILSENVTSTPALQEVSEFMLIHKDQVPSFKPVKKSSKKIHLGKLC